MLELLGIVVVLVALAGIWVAAMYNRLRALQYACADAWSLVDVQLQRRADLVPSLVATVQAYAAHERAALEAVTSARAEADPLHEPSPAHARAEAQLSSAIARVVALREGYPQLAAAPNFQQLQRTIVELENEIAASREIYNGNVAAYRDRLGQVPSSWVAKRFDFEDRPPFELQLAIEREPTTVVLPGCVPPPSL